jgi:hypothetical protein
MYSSGRNTRNCVRRQSDEVGVAWQWERERKRKRDWEKERERGKGEPVV